MSQSEIERFVADLKANADLRAEVEKMQSHTPQTTGLDAVVSFAAAKGYHFTAEGMKEHARARAKAGGKLTDAELDAVAGGSELNLLFTSFRFGHGFQSPDETSTFDIFRQEKE